MDPIALWNASQSLSLTVPVLDQVWSFIQIGAYLSLGWMGGQWAARKIGKVFDDTLGRLMNYLQTLREP
jgi:hypothetical protein